MRNHTPNSTIQNEKKIQFLHKLNLVVLESNGKSTYVTTHTLIAVVQLIKPAITIRVGVIFRCNHRPEGVASFVLAT